MDDGSLAIFTGKEYNKYQEIVQRDTIMHEKKYIAPNSCRIRTHESDSLIEYADILGHTSCDDGPGIRTVLFLQGCSKACPGCHNTTIHSRGNGKVVTVQELVDLVMKKCRNRKLTISGGEPLEQLPALLSLLAELKRRGFNLCLYTGWKLDEVPQQILALLDVIKVGDFRQELSHEPLCFVGSSNQRMYQLKDGEIKSELQLKEER